MSIDHNFWRERRAEADSNRGPSASHYIQPNVLPLGQTGSECDYPARLPPTPSQCLGAHFYAWLNTHIFVILAFVSFFKLQRSETSGKLQLTSATVWTYFEFCTQQTQYVVESAPLCSFSDRPCVMLHQRLHLKQNNPPPPFFFLMQAQ